jgi:hypothetical protein
MCHAELLVLRSEDSIPVEAAFLGLGPALKAVKSWHMPG